MADDNNENPEMEFIAGTPDEIIQQLQEMGAPDEVIKQVKIHIIKELVEAEPYHREPLLDETKVTLSVRLGDALYIHHLLTEQLLRLVEQNEQGEDVAHEGVVCEAVTIKVSEVLQPFDDQLAGVVATQSIEETITDINDFLSDK